MSRPAQPESNMFSNRRGVIDFVSAPMPMNTALYPAEDMYMQANYAPMPQAVYTMSGYPAAQGQPATIMQAPYTLPVQPMPSAYPAVYTNSPYYQYPVAPAAQAAGDPSQRSIASQQSITEETLQKKVDSKIEAIMAAHKTDMLSQQISRLTDKVQKLSNNIEYKQSSASPRHGGLSSTSDSDESEMSRRLKKLAAESGRRAGESRPTPLF